MTHRSLVVVWLAVFAVLALLALRFVGIARIAPTSVAPFPAAAPNQDVPPDWSRVDTGPFSVALPPGWRYEPRQGIDSFVGLLVGDGIQLMFDLGMYWNSPPSDTSRHDVLRERVDFRVAEIHRPRQASDIFGLFIEHTTDFTHLGAPEHLSIVGRVPLEMQEVVLQVFRSVRFRRMIVDGGRWERVAPPAGEVMLLDLDLLGGWEPWVVGARIAADGTAEPLAFRPTDGGWDERPLRGAKGILSIAGNWVASQDALFHYDDESDQWQRERTVAAEFPVLDVAVDRGFNEQGWAIGAGVIRLADGRSTEADGGWGSAGGWAIDVLPRSPLAPIARPVAPDAMAVGAADAHVFSGGKWRALAWQREDFHDWDVDLVAADEAWIVGSEASHRRSFLHRLGDVIASAPVTATDPVLAVDMLSPAEGWAVGGGYFREVAMGELWRFRDGTWERQSSPCACQLLGVQAQPNGEAWAVGYSIGEGPTEGVVLRYVPAASTPMPHASATVPDSTATANATPSATQQADVHRLWLPWAYKPLPAR